GMGKKKGQRQSRSPVRDSAAPPEGKAKPGSRSHPSRNTPAPAVDVWVLPMKEPTEAAVSASAGADGSAAADSARAKTGSASARRRGSSKKGQRASNARDPNPFVQFEHREQGLIRERKLLLEDAAYMNQRREDLRHGTVIKRLLQSYATED
ncbi:unnamed protein product, partial [Polarella glacialis]